MVISMTSLCLSLKQQFTTVLMGGALTHKSHPDTSVQVMLCVVFQSSLRMKSEDEVCCWSFA